MEDKELYELMINDSEEGLYQLICKYKGFVWNITNKVLFGRYQDIESECLTDNDEIESLIEDIYQEEVVDLILDGLKDLHKDIFIKRHIFMETIEEISDDVNLNERQVRNILYQSKLKLKKLLTGRVQNETGFFENNREL